MVAVFSSFAGRMKLSLQVNVECGTDGVLPPPVKEAMEAAVLAEWQRRGDARKTAGEGGLFHCLEELLVWCEEQYVKLLSIEPVFVSRFIAEKATGGNEWRYCILEPTVKPLVEEEEEPELTAEQKASEAARIERELARAEAAAQEREAWAAERRRLAELEGPKPRQFSKKEQEEIKAAKRGQGDRTAKTGPRRRKFDPESGRVGKFDPVE